MKASELLEAADPKKKFLDSFVEAFPDYFEEGKPAEAAKTFWQVLYDDNPRQEAKAKKIGLSEADVLAYFEALKKSHNDVHDQLFKEAEEEDGFLEKGIKRLVKVENLMKEVDHVAISFWADCGAKYGQVQKLSDIALEGQRGMDFAHPPAKFTADSEFKTITAEINAVQMGNGLRAELWVSPKKKDGTFGVAIRLSWVTLKRDH